MNIRPAQTAEKTTMPSYKLNFLVREAVSLQVPYRDHCWEKETSDFFSAVIFPHSLLQIVIESETFVQRYIDLLADGFHFKLEITEYIEDADIAIWSDNIMEFYMSYSSPISDVSTTFAIHAARPLDKTLILAKPFDVMIWICIPFSFLIILLTTYGIMKKENEYRNEQMTKFSTLFWIILRSFLRQDTEIDRYVSITFRILIGCWILIAFVLTSAYVGTLPSFMVNPGTETIPQTFQELAQSVKEGQYNITFFADSIEHYYFHQLEMDTKSKKKIIKNDVIKTFYENYEKLNELIEEPIDRVLDGTHAVLAPKQKIELNMSKWQKEEVFISEDILFTQFMFVQINLFKVNYSEEICKVVNRIQQSGLSEKIHRDIVDEKQRNYYSYNNKTIDNNNEEPLKMDDIMGLLYLLVTGYLIASV
ncbi:ionotropic receptor 93a-like, partial [Centruroides vittatus]|uniref:ionotropic receptor 93a-like n=1 Tax=Centruroides vittatus TaxID=120091 RepID=UPI003510561F